MSASAVDLHTSAIQPKTDFRNAQRIHGSLTAQAEKTPSSGWPSALRAGLIPTI